MTRKNKPRRDARRLSRLLYSFMLESEDKEYMETAIGLQAYTSYLRLKETPDLDAYIRLSDLLGMGSMVMNKSDESYPTIINALRLMADKLKLAYTGNKLSERDMGTILLAIHALDTVAAFTRAIALLTAEDTINERKKFLKSEWDGAENPIEILYLKEWKK